MIHQDKYISSITGQTRVGFYKDGILKEVRVYDHLNGEWNKRIQEETEWCKEQGHSTKFLNR